MTQTVESENEKQTAKIEATLDAGRHEYELDFVWLRFLT